MPHLDVYALESDLTDREEALIGALTSAVVAVYGEWARPDVVIRLFGVPAGRWGVGGGPAAAPAPSVTFGVRADVFDRPDAATVLGALAAGVTEAVAAALGDHDRRRGGITVEFVGRRPGRTAVGGALSA